MNTTRLVLVLTLAHSSWVAGAADEAWPSLPKDQLTFKNLGDKYAKNIKTETVEISRAGKRIASLTKIDRDGNGSFEEFAFSAFVSAQRVLVLSRIGATNESAQFFSYDDTMVMNDVRFPESKLVALIVMSKKHGCYEIFARHADGHYWPADNDQRKTADSFLRANAEKMRPLIKELKK